VSDFPRDWRSLVVIASPTLLAVVALQALSTHINTSEANAASAATLQSPYSIR
jgi:hypothetical protein